MQEKKHVNWNYNICPETEGTVSYLLQCLQSVLFKIQSFDRILSLFVFLPTLRARQNAAQLVKILRDTTQQNV